ncbi:MAG TPA: helix-turn-helix domain-containing protein [Thermoanaerobaculia bacterium]|nr:helix-turn-helix domain-containing protein [Thermoanaerobaculia bacterium]
MKQRTEVPRDPAAMLVRGEEVRAIRYKLKQSQSEFAMMIGVSLATLQGWEEGRHHPDGPALALLRVAAKSPKLVAKALGH